MKLTNRIPFLLLLALALAQTQTGDVQERLWKLRNLGKAFYENPTTQVEAVGVFRQALQLAPTSSRERLNYGLALLRAGKTQEGIAELEKVQKQDPSLPHTWFNLGIVYRKNGEFDRAIPQFQKMTALVPDEPVSHYNLGVLYKQTAKTEEALEQFQIATRLNPNLAAPHFQLYNLYRQAGKKEEAARELATFTRIKKETEGAAIPEDMEWSDYAEVHDPIDIKDTAGQPPDVPRTPLPAGAAGQLLIDVRGDGKPLPLRWSEQGISIDGAKNTGLEDLRSIVSVAAGDFDNDGLADLCILTDAAPLLYHNVKGRFARSDASLPTGRFEKAVWLDYDHDYDLDLLLLGEKSVLMRNQGTAGFADHTADFPFVPGHAVDAVKYRWQADSKAFDLVVSYQDHAGVLYRDKLAGKYEAVPVAELSNGAHLLSAEDVNRDSWLDIVSSAGTLLNHHGKFAHEDQPIADGSAPVDGPLSNSNWIRVALLGVKNLKLAYDAEVEVKAGASYQKKMYEGVPLVFDLGRRKEADTVRIAWPNGLIQNATKQAANKSYEYKEEQRLSGSCPMIWTWNGSQFEFITDVLGIAPLGASSGDGQYFPVDHDEYIQIPAGALQAVNGRFQVRLTEELSEASFLDQVHLIAVDHKATTEIFTNEKWKGPPFPDFRLYGLEKRIYPHTATDGHGVDVLPALLARDGKYPHGFRHDFSGQAEVHNLDLDFGPDVAPDNRAVLVLNGWVDWADGSTFLSASQEGKGGLLPPYLQVKDSTGNWKTVIEDMGMPDGKPKTIAVDLTGKFLSASREVRIVTNLCVYWDEIFLSEDSAVPAAKLRRVPAASAMVHFRGFSQSRISPDRSQPETFFYAVSTPTSYWNPTPGLYTRYGDVRELIESVDDRFVIMGSGDELQLEFQASALPPVRLGWKRDYLLKVDGWAKDRDANTAFSQSVEPLPFHAMSRYPYPPNEHYPQDAVHNAYRRDYNTRPALRLIRPLIGDNQHMPKAIGAMGN